MTTFLQIVLMLIAVAGGYKIGSNDEAKKFKVDTEMELERKDKSIESLKKSLDFVQHERDECIKQIKDLELDKAAMTQLCEAHLETLKGWQKSCEAKAAVIVGLESQLAATKIKPTRKPRKAKADVAAV